MVENSPQLTTSKKSKTYIHSKDSQIPNYFNNENKKEKDNISIKNFDSKSLAKLKPSAQEVIQKIKVDVEMGKYGLNNPLASQINNLLSGIDSSDLRNEHVQKMLVELAQDEAKKGGEHTIKLIENIQSFHIEKAFERSNIAKLCIKKGGECTIKLIENIQSFHIEESVFSEGEIARLCIKQGGNCTIKLMENIQYFNIKNVFERAQIAKLCANQGAEVSLYLDNFNLKSDDKPLDIRSELINIAFLCSKKGYRIFPYFKDYGFDPKDFYCRQVLFDLAKTELDLLLVLAKTSDNLQLEEESFAEVLCYYANNKPCNEGSRSYLDVIIKTYLKDSNFIWYKTAKITALYSPSQTIISLVQRQLHLNKEEALDRKEILISTLFGLIEENDEHIEMLYDFVTKIIKEWLPYLPNPIQNLKDIKENNLLKEVKSLDKEICNSLYELRSHFGIQYLDDDDEIESFAEEFSFLLCPQLLNLIDTPKEKDDSWIEKQKQALNEIETLAQKGLYSPLLAKELQKFIEKGHPHLLKTSVLWAISIIHHLRETKENYSEKLDHIVANLMNLPNPELRHMYSNSLLKLHTNKSLTEVLKVYDNIYNDIKQYKKYTDLSQSDKNLSLLILPLIEGMTTKQNFNKIKEIINKILLLKTDSTILLKNVPKFERLLNTLILLNKIPAFSFQDKEALLDKIINSSLEKGVLDKKSSLVDSVLNKCIQTSSLILLNKGNLWEEQDTLKKLAYSNDYEAELKEAIDTVVYEKVIPENLNQQDVGVFLNRLRRPELLYFHLLQLKNIQMLSKDKKLVKESIDEFWNKGIKRGEYPAYRYNAPNSEVAPHLYYLFHQLEDGKNLKKNG